MTYAPRHSSQNTASFWFPTIFGGGARRSWWAWPGLGSGNGPGERGGEVGALGTRSGATSPSLGFSQDFHQQEIAVLSSMNRIQHSQTPKSLCLLGTSPSDPRTIPVHPLCLRSPPRSPAARPPAPAAGVGHWQAPVGFPVTGIPGVYCLKKNNKPGSEPACGRFVFQEGEAISMTRRRSCLSVRAGTHAEVQKRTRKILLVPQIPSQTSPSWRK